MNARVQQNHHPLKSAFDRPGLLFILSLCLLTSPARAAEDWLRTYNGAESLGDYPVGISTSSDGGGYIYGTSASLATEYDGLLLRYDWNGDVGWANLYDGGVNANDSWADAGAVALNDVILNGVVTGDSTDMITTRFDQTGVVVWQNIFDRPGALTWEQGTHIAVRDDGSSVAVGHFGDATVAHGVVVVSYALDGTLEWSRTFHFDPLDTHLVSDARIDAAGNVFVLGAAGDLTDPTLSDFDLFVQKIDRSGDLGWRIDRDSGFVDIASTLTLDSNDDLIVTGQSGIDIPSVDLLRFGADGSEIWSTSLSAAGIAYLAVDSKIGPNGNIVLLVQRTDANDNLDILTRTYDANGAFLWDQVYASADDGIDRATGLTIDAVGSVYVTGTVGPAEFIGNGVLTLKYSADGTEEWMEVYEALDPAGIQSIAIEEDAFGSILVAAGVYPDSTEDFNVLLLSYAAATSGAEDTPSGTRTPTRVELSSSFPNPARENATVRFALPTDGGVTIELLSVDGRRLATVLNEPLAAGYHQIDLPVTDLAAGVYFYRMTTGKERRTRKLTVSR